MRSAVYAVLDKARTPPAQQCGSYRKKSLDALADRFSLMTRSRGIVSVIVLLLGTILVADHVVVASDHPPTVARSSPQITATSTLATSSLAAHDKLGNEVRAISTQHRAAGANSPPWRPPVVEFRSLGGAVMSKPIRVHLIWYGSWGKKPKATIRKAIMSLTPPTRTRDMPNLANWWKIVEEYFQSDGARVSNSVTIGSEVTDSYSKGKALGDVQRSTIPQDIIRGNIGPNKLPSDPVNGLYLIMTTSDVTFVRGDFCGFHSYICIDRSKSCSDAKNLLVYAFMPFPGQNNQLLQICNVYQPYGAIPLPAPNDAASPVGGALDSFISVMMHELMEAATDPYVNAWRLNTYENSEAADLCSYSYGAGDFYYIGLPSVYGDHANCSKSHCESYPGVHVMQWGPTGEIFNIFGIGGSRFLVQKIWSLGNKGCQLQVQDACKASTTLTAPSGVIERGVHAFGSIPLQTYSPGETCTWVIDVPNAKNLTLTFNSVATGYDQLDHIDVFQGRVLRKRINGAFISRVVVNLKGNKASVKWTSYGGRSPFPDATGFYMTYNSTR